MCLVCSAEVQLAKWNFFMPWKGGAAAPGPIWPRPKGLSRGPFSGRAYGATRRLAALAPPQEASVGPPSPGPKTRNETPLPKTPPPLILRPSHEHGTRERPEMPINFEVHAARQNLACGFKLQILNYYSLKL
jgi:hypothetical protein